jgi:hypothetical protein
MKWRRGKGEEARLGGSRCDHISNWATLSRSFVAGEGDDWAVRRCAQKVARCLRRSGVLGLPNDRYFQAPLLAHPAFVASLRPLRSWRLCVKAFVD